MKNLISFIKPIENFFDNVKINHQDIKLKNNRLELLFYVNNKINKNINFINYIKKELKMSKWVYNFGFGKADGNAEMRDILGW